MLFWGEVVHLLEKNLLSCPTKTYFHFDCPGCGFQRSIIALMKGNIIESFQLYPAGIPIIILLIFSLFHIKYKFNKGDKLIQYSQISIAIIIFVSYIFKLTNYINIY
ncbi:MAG: DUF2752 domain-containing protein [Chitinophagaceae bacterium]